MLKEQQKERICILIKQEASSLRSTQPIATLLMNHGYDVEYVGIFDQKAITYFEENQFNYVAFENPDVAVETAVRIEKMTNKQKRKNYTAQIDFEKELLLKCYEFYRESPPVLVLFEVLNTSWTMPFVKLGVPLLGISITLSTEFNLHLPSVHTNYVPSKRKNFKDSVFILKDWLTIYVFAYLKHKLIDLIILRLTFGFSKIPKNSFKKFFKKNGFKLLWGDYPLNDFRISIPSIVCCPKEFDFPHRKRSDEIFYAGSSILLDRKETVDFDWREVDSNRKNIYATLGSMPEYTDEKLRANFYRSILEAATQLQDSYNFILQIGDETDLKGMYVPPNVYLYSWVSHMTVFKNISLIICHAGLGTLREALYHGIPSVVFPALGDQPGNASRILYHKLGLQGNLDTINGKEMLRLISKVTTDEEIQKAVQDFRNIFREQQEFPLGIEFFERYMRKTVKSPTKFQEVIL